VSLVAGVGQLRDEVVDGLLGRAASLRDGAAPASYAGSVVSLLFLDTSLRTRVGFAAAAARLRATPVEVLRTRGNAVSMPESWEDTARTIAGYSDVMVARVAHSWAERPLPGGVDIPVLNAGDRGPFAEHPSQAMVDLFALEQLVGPIAGLHIAMCGDLRMRASRSLLGLLARRPPTRLTLVTEPALLPGLVVPPALAEVTSWMRLDELSDVDALYVVGIPHGALPEDGRTRLRVGAPHLRCLSPRGGVFSPLPVIDEWENGVVTHPRMRAYEQSDLGLHVRVAMLEWLLEQGQRIS
jgi:aspartate carbamoyltransferase catalytic subunit